MSIRKKLYLLILGMMVLLISSALLYFLLQLPVKRVERERQVLEQLVERIQDLEITVNRLDVDAFTVLRSRLQEDIANYEDAFKQLEKIVYLRKINDELTEAIATIENLQVYNSENLRDLLVTYDELYNTIFEIFLSPSSLTLKRLYNDDLVPPAKKELYFGIKYNVSQIEHEMSLLNDSLESSIRIVREQGETIDRHIRNIQQRALLLTILALAALVALIMIISTIAVNRIANGIVSIGKGVESLAQGDLSVAFTLKATDEVGRLSSTMTEFIARLNDSISGIKDSAQVNAQVRERLTEATRQAGVALSEMNGAIAEVQTQARALDERVGATRTSVGTISGGVRALDDRLSDQIAMVEESTASITQMLATIANMARLSETNRQLADGLVRTADSSREVFATTLEKIEAISERVGKIEELLEIIETIADQTNLLAMNAAIEAAHAGESGKGFAVVADEIRKLAEASSEGSREISDSVRAIVESIQSARSGSDDMNRAFGEIEGSIRDVTQSVVEISASLAETDTGGRQILTAMTSLREASTQINGESKLMAENTRSIDSVMGELNTVADRVRESMAEIARRSEVIASSSSNSADLARKLEELGSQLDQRTAYFKTKA